MSQPLATPLLRATTATFENLALLAAEPAAGWPDTVDGRAAASVVFDGASRGRLDLIVSRALLPVITGNMLGVVHASDPALQEDALGELANVICGNILGDLDSVRVEVRTTPPAAYAPELVEGEPVTRACIRLDGGMAEARLYLGKSVRST